MESIEKEVKIISYDFGHGVGEDRGAYGIFAEELGIRQYGSIAVNELMRVGYTLVNCTPVFSTMTLQESLEYRVEKANASGSQLHLCFHLNAFDGTAHGAEVEVGSDTSLKFGEAILNEIVKLGFTNRGVKEPELYVTKNTIMPCVLLEPFFCDSASDFALYNPNTLGKAIAQGIINFLGTGSQSTVAETVKPTSDSKAIELQHNLNRLGMTDVLGSSLTEDGILGNKTKEAVRRFQQIVGLVVDGIAGVNTWSAINSILDKPLLRVGCSGIPVMFLQWKVGCQNSGNFTRGTETTIKVYQRGNSLIPDGIVGNCTWTKIIG